jgi:hypothetical protein
MCDKYYCEYIVCGGGSNFSVGCWVDNRVLVDMTPFFAWMDTVGFWDWWFFGFGIAIGLAIGAGGMVYYYDKTYQPLLGFVSGVRQEAERRRRHEKG